VQNQFHRAGITPHIEQLPIFGIHKEIYLAFRYRLSDNQVSSRIYNDCSIPTDSKNSLVEYSSN
jgi:hypothetical protein